MGKYSNPGGRRPKTDPSVNRYVVRLNDEENARFLAMFDKSGADNKAAFIKNFLFQKPFKVFTIDEGIREFIDKLSGLNSIYRTIGGSYDLLLRMLRENFTEKKAIAAIAELERKTVQLVALSQDIVALARQFDEYWRSTNAKME